MWLGAVTEVVIVNDIDQISTAYLSLIIYEKQS